MPELPEVETIRRGLAKFIEHAIISRVEILCDKSFIGPKEVVEGQEIVAINRRGKALLIELKNSITMMIHLRMTGQLIFRACGTEDGKNLTKMVDSGQFDGKLADQSSFAGGHPTDSFFTALPNTQTRVIFEITDQKGQQIGTLFFNDQRKFGFVKPIPTTEVEDDAFIKKLAKEPWDMSFDEFKKNLMRHKAAPVKATILDQSVIAGVGNIYADEALFDAKIHPARETGSLKDDEIKNLLTAIAKVMDASINSGGSTMATYVRADGTKGDYLEKFAQVFRRENLPCYRCGTEIIKTRIAGRGTHICPNCQKLGGKK